jgi:DNA-binding response OmpR family regulator
MSHGSTRPTVLLIEADTSLRRLIALGLEYRSMHVIEASSAWNLPTFGIGTKKPDLLILDVDGAKGGDWTLIEAAQAHPYLSTLPVVVLTWECPVAVGAASEEQNSLQGHTTCLTKPFDARALHTTIEALLVADSTDSTDSTAQETARKQDILLITQQATAAPSIWPLMTAAGLLLAFIGLMGVLAITALGLCIVLVSLLWWTLGTGGKKQAVALR